MKKPRTVLKPISRKKQESPAERLSNLEEPSAGQITMGVLLLGRPATGKTMAIDVHRFQQFLKDYDRLENNVQNDEPGES